ncbi:MAG: hypothetical protein GX783_11380 [Clostridiales bacterium]|nr:hypothetical protein [Clostridiales bacterium]
MIPDAELYHFSILTSNVHSAWLRTVGGRMKSDYQYSKDIVYNNFPWPELNRKAKVLLDKTGKALALTLIGEGKTGLCECLCKYLCKCLAPD